MKRFLLIFSLAVTMIAARAQEVLTLEDCLRLAIHNNISLKMSQNEVAKGKHGISENRAKLA